MGGARASSCVGEQPQELGTPVGLRDTLPRPKGPPHLPRPPQTHLLHSRHAGLVDGMELAEGGPGTDSNRWPEAAAWANH